MTDMGKNCVGKLVPFIREMQDNWVRTVSDIRSSAHEIYRSAGEIAAGNSDLSSRTKRWASAWSCSGVGRVIAMNFLSLFPPIGMLRLDMREK